MSTNDSNSPQNTGTGAGANYGSNTGTSHNTGVEGDDFSATAKGAAAAGTAGAMVGRAVDGVQNTADHAAHAVTGQSYDSSPSTNMTGMFRDRQSAENAYQSLSSRGYGQDDVNVLM